jgi:hypothetical protein
MKRIALLLALTILAAGSTGCTTGITEALKAGLGGRPYVAEITTPGTDPYPLAGYEHIELGTFTDEFGGRVPNDLMPAVRASLYGTTEEPGELADNGLPTGSSGSGKTLVIRGKIFHYEGKDIVGAMISPLDQVVARAEMVDKESGRVMATANLIGRTTSRTRHNVDVVAEGLARAIAKWVKMHHSPKE